MGPARLARAERTVNQQAANKRRAMPDVTTEFLARTRHREDPHDAGTAGHRERALSPRSFPVLNFGFVATSPGK
jgi:hypothetical protein